MTPDAPRAAPDAPRVAVLGPVTVATADGRTADLGTTARALVAALALAAPESRSAVALADDVWGDDPPQNPRAALQTLVSRVRAAAGADVIRSTAAGYVLGTDDLDLSRARGLARDAAALADADPARVQLADRALALWRGEPGADLGDAPIAAEVTDAAAALRGRVAASRARGLVATGRADEAVADLASLAAARPYDEAAHAELMTALAAAGREADALAVFAGLRDRLRDDLGSSPGADTTALHARLLRGEHIGEHSGEYGAATGTRTSVHTTRIGLRAAPNALLGRDGDLAAIADQLATSRLVTILGAGGLGKTRLAQAAAAASVAPVVVVVELASVRSDDDVLPAIATVLGISDATPGARLSDALPRTDLRSRVVGQLGERPTLVVLDNCEQIIDGVAGWTADALAAAPSLRVLATSRTPFGIAAEAVYPLGSLSAGPADSAAARDEPGDGDELGPAVRLFVDRARAVRPGAGMPLDVVARLCDRLDGLPLAIELAAARVRTMTPEQIEVRLEDRFALLTTGDRTAPERHRTLEAVIAWSWDLLDADARVALETLSMLPAGFSARTAADLLIEDRVDDLLDRLVAQSLLVVAEDARTGDIRFRMLETVREFGLARLAGREDAAWDAVFGWARAFAEARVARVFDVETFHEIRSESDNLLFALRRAIDRGQDADVVLMFAVLSLSWIVRASFSEMESFGGAVFDALGRVSDRDLPAEALVSVMVLTTFFMMFAEDPRATRVIARLRILRRRHPELPAMQRALADVAGAATAVHRMTDELDRVRADSDPIVALVGEIVATQLAENNGETDAGKASALRAWKLAEELDQAWLGGMAASSYGQLAGQAGDARTALEWIERSELRFARYLMDDDLREQSWIRGNSLVSLGRLDEARAIFQALADTSDPGPDGREMASIGWFGLAEVARAGGETDVAAGRYLRAMQPLRTMGQRGSSWYLMAMAGLVSAATFDGSLPPDEIAGWARRLRSRVRAVRRLRPEFVDRPVLGSVLCGWSAWAITVPDLQARGLEALALTELIGARQDLPSLHLDVHVAHAVAIAGPDAVARGRAAASALPAAERVDRAFAVLSAPLP